MGEGVICHTFTLQEDRCVRLLLKNLGRGMPESVVREELESLEFSCLGSHAAAFRPSRPGPSQGPLSHTHFVLSVARGPEVSKVCSITELCGLRVSVESYVATKGPLQWKRYQRFGHTKRNCGYAPRCVACGGFHLFGGCSTPREQPQCCGCGGNDTAIYRAISS